MDDLENGKNASAGFAHRTVLPKAYSIHRLRYPDSFIVITKTVIIIIVIILINVKQFMFLLFVVNMKRKSPPILSP